jgi:hypothetical protein
MIDTVDFPFFIVYKVLSGQGSRKLGMINFSSEMGLLSKKYFQKSVRYFCF